ncbi:MAG TPA: CPBP family intramembrane glutamic endopeptidase [Longimicrobiales bacterium]|nr:CPBP family intramembrane glutamic endopeptidase [Longimicrobiales bacterium]
MIPLPRNRVYIASSLFLWILAYCALYAGAQLKFTPRLMGFNSLPLQLHVIWTLFGLLSAAALLVLFKAFGYAESEMMVDLVPTTNVQRVLFVLLAVSAGVCEEIVFRGFMIPALFSKTNSLIVAVVISSAVFGILHIHQRPAGALRAGLLGAVLAVPFVSSGSIYPAMAAHTIIDIIGGFWLMKWMAKSQ